MNEIGQESQNDLKTNVADQKKHKLRSFFLSVLKSLLYSAFILCLVLAALWGLESLAKWGLSKTYLSAVYPTDISMARKDFTRPVSHYDYDFVPGVCLEYNTLKGNRYEYANNAGFREPRDITLEKPSDEYRIFLVGGSTAYGLGAIGEATPLTGYYGIEYRETISHVMEKILNASVPIPGKTIKVYNTAVWGYAYQHHLMRYVTKLRRYNPDMVVSLDGANEILPISKLTPDWNYFEQGQFNGILKEIFAYNQPGLASYLTLWLKNNTFLMTYIWSGKDIFQEFEEPIKLDSESVAFTKKEPGSHKKLAEIRSEMVDSNIASVVSVIGDYHSVLENDRVPHIIALQPWFYLSKKPLHEKEQVLSGLTGHREYFGVPSDKIYRLLCDKIAQSAQEKGYLSVDFTDYFDDVSEWVFTDWCHLTSGANYLLAKELANVVKEHFIARPLTDGDRITEKNSYFWDLAASANLLYAPPSDAQENDPRNMLTGYPAEFYYSSRKLTQDDRPEVVLDLGEKHPISRLRIVWADDKSVPQKWSIEVSADQENWDLFLDGSGKETDRYSRWPGMEYYAPEPVEARYVKYKIDSGVGEAIRLRLISVAR